MAVRVSSRILQAIGALALVALVAGSFAALATVRERVQVTIAEEKDARRGPDPTELLRADVAELRDDLAILTEALGKSTEELAAALEASSAERSEAQAAEIARLRDEIAESRASVERSIASLEQRLGSMGDGSRVATSTAPPNVEEAPARPSGAETAEAPPTATPAQPEREAAAGGTTTPRKFLSFSLPSRGAGFEGRQKLAIVPSLSRVGFDAKSTLHDFTGATEKVEGEIVVDLSKTEEGCRGEIRARAAALDTGLAGRDEEMRKRLEVAKHPDLRFEWTSFAARKVDPAAQSIEGTAKGVFEIHGVRREVEAPVRVSVDKSRRVAIEGELRLRMSDYGIDPPSQLGFVKVEDEVRVWFALRARSMGAAGDDEGAGAPAQERPDGR